MSTLEALRDLLRDEARWPEGFRFNFGDFDTCAIGLACRTGLIEGEAETVEATQLGITEKTYWDLFISSHLGEFRRATSAEVIADRIDAYLAATPP